MCFVEDDDNPEPPIVPTDADASTCDPQEVDLRERKSSKADWLEPFIGQPHELTVVRAPGRIRTCIFLETAGFKTKRGVRGTFRSRIWIKLAGNPSEMLVLTAGTSLISGLFLGCLTY